ncbi:MAG: O-antigen/teichoic acid export membrane protein [Bacteroidia bacterium]|jgi:O-antigen/teichoic acid export membrane protein
MQVLNLLVKPIWVLIIDAAVQDVLSPEVYGNYFALFNFSMLFFIVLDLGLNSFNITEVSRDNSKIASLAGSILGLKLLLSVVYVGIVFSVGYILGYTSQEFSLLIILCGIQILSSFVQYFRSIVASLQKFKLDGVFLVLDRILVIAFVSALLWGEIPVLSLTITRFALAQVLSLSIVVLVLLVFLRNHLGNMRISFQLDSLRPLLKKAWPFAILVTLMGLYTYMDGVMIKQLVGDAEAGTYALGYRLYFAILMFAQVFSVVLLPFFSKNIADSALIRSISGYTARLLLFGGLVASFITTVYSLDILTIINPGKANSDSAEVLVLLIFGFVGASLTLVYGALLTAGKELKWLNRFAAITLLLNLILNLVLIPRYNAQGAALATMTSQIFFGLICFFVSVRKYNLHLTFTSFLRPFLGVGLLALIIFWGKQYAQNMSVHFVMIFITVLLAAYLFKLYKLKDFKSVLKK